MIKIKEMRKKAKLQEIIDIRKKRLKKKTENMTRRGRTRKKTGFDIKVHYEEENKDRRYILIQKSNTKRKGRIEKISLMCERNTKRKEEI